MKFPVTFDNINLVDGCTRDSQGGSKEKYVCCPQIALDKEYVSQQQLVDMLVYVAISRSTSIYFTNQIPAFQSFSRYVPVVLMIGFLNVLASDSS